MGYPATHKLSHGENSAQLRRLPGLANHLARLGGVPHLTCELMQSRKIERLCEEIGVTSPRWSTSPTRGPPTPGEQALRRKTDTLKSSMDTWKVFFVVNNTSIQECRCWTWQQNPGGHPLDRGVPRSWPYLRMKKMKYDTPGVTWFNFCWVCAAGI